ncbi:MAG: zinc ribbon domain-containing protein [Endomicrobiia bacterium]
MGKTKFLIFFLPLFISIIYGGIICDRCGIENPDENMFCQDCGARLVKSKSTIFHDEKPASQNQEKICLSCKTKNLISAKFCQNCGVKLSEISYKKEQSLKFTNIDASKKTGAIVFSMLFPGAGHIYLGHKQEKIKGIILASASGGLILSSILMWSYAEARYKEYEDTKDEFAYEDYSSSIDIVNFLLVTLAGVWVYNVVDIFITTSKVGKFSHFGKDFEISINFSSKKFEVCFAKKF